MSEYLVLKKTLKAGNVIYKNGSVVYPPYPPDLQSEVDNNSIYVERVVIDEKIVDEPKKKSVKKRIKK